jgi:hypothetical protein
MLQKAIEGGNPVEHVETSLDWAETESATETTGHGTGKGQG